MRSNRFLSLLILFALFAATDATAASFGQSGGASPLLRGGKTWHALDSIASSWASVPRGRSPLKKVSAADAARVDEVISKVPLRFERNEGQAPGNFDFMARGTSYAMLIQPTRASMSMQGEAGNADVSFALVGACGNAPAIPADISPTLVNYYIGQKRTQWHTGVPSFERVRYAGIYDGVDVEYYGRGGRLEYDFIVAPNADPSAIRMRFVGMESLAVEHGNVLTVATAAGEIRHALEVYQRDAVGSRIPIAATFRIDSGDVTFDLGPYDRSKQLVIDPAILDIQWFSGASFNSIAIDGSGNLYVAGGTFTPGIPLVSPIRTHVVRGTNSTAQTEGFVEKIDPNGRIIYSTFLGGDREDGAMDIAVDGAGNAYVTGQTSSADFPTTAGAFRTGLGLSATGADDDGFVTKLSPTGSLVYSTYTAGMQPSRIALSPTGSAVISGYTGTVTPATVDLRAHNYFVGGDLAVMSFNSDGTAVNFSTIVGETGSLDTGGVTVDDGGNVYFAATTYSSAMPVTPGVFQPNCLLTQLDGCWSGMAGKLNPDGSLSWLTYLGGSLRTEPHDIAVDSAHDVYVVGQTCSLDFPVTSDAFQRTADPGDVPPIYQENAFYARLDSSGSVLKYGTYINAYSASEVKVDSLGNAYVLGSSASSATFVPVNAFPYPQPGNWLVAFDSSNHVQMATGIGGGYPAGLALDSNNNPVVGIAFAYGQSQIRTITKSGSQTLLVTGLSPRGSEVAGAGFQLGAEAGEFDSTTRAWFGGVAATNLVVYPQNPWELDGMTPAHGPGVVDVVATTGGGATATLHHAFEFYNGPAQVSSVYPAEVNAGERAVVGVTGTGFPREAYVTFGPSGSSAILGRGARIDSTMIQATLPADVPAGVYDVNVEAYGHATLTLPAALTVRGPQLYGMEPSLGFSNGGYGVFLDGNDPDVGLTTSVVIGGLPATLGTAYSGEIGLTVPAHAPGRVDVDVATSLGSHSIPGGFLYVQALSATSLTPTSGPPTGGTSVTITGTGFLPGAVVTVENVLVPSVVGPTTITLTMPPHAPGAARIYVQNPDGGYTSLPNGTSAATFTYSGPQVGNVTTLDYPRVRYAPATGGTTVEVVANGVDDHPRVFFGSVEATVTKVNLPWQVLVTTPQHSAGTVDVTVVNSNGESGTSPHAFTFTEPQPVITAVTPTQSIAQGGMTMVITGTGFSPNAHVTIGYAALLDPVITPTQISGVVPPHYPQVTAVQVMNPDGLYATYAFEFTAPPKVTSVTPSNGPSTGGTTVTIAGEHFGNPATVTFGGTAAASVTWQSANQMQAVTPAHAAGDVAVAVTNSDTQTGSLSNGFRFLPPPPTITGFTPMTATIGSSIVITGTNFIFVTGVTFTNSAVAVYTVDSDTQITATVPASAVSGPIAVTTASGTVTSSSSFTRDTSGPRIDSFTPTSGGTGTSVTITGVRFTGATQVQFGGVSASSFTINSDTQITAVVPATALTGPITVTSSLGIGASSSNFTAAPRFAATPFTPSSGPSGASVTINGVNFQGTTQVLFNGVAATPFTVNTGGTTITTTVPTAASTGPITVTTPVASVTTTTSFAVAPTITSFTPPGGGAGTVVTITGLHFMGATTVTFGGTAATFTVVNDTTITATVPASSPTGVIVVTTPSGSAASSTSFLSGAKITSFTPIKGSAGTAVTITGQYFTGATAVTFSGVSATFTVVNDTTITATAPTGAMTGPISVTTPVATTSSTANFFMPITVTGFTPTSGPQGTVITITGTSMTGVSQITINGMKFVVGAFFPISPTQLRATVPNLASTGPLVISSPYYSVQTTASFTVTPGPPPTYRGDSNGDGVLDAADVFYLIRYLFAGGTAPIHTADANNDGKVNAGDIFFLINYIFSGGPAPAASVPVRIQSVERTAPLTLSLGTPVRRGSEFAVPVIVSGGEVGALALQLRVEGGVAEDVKIVRSSKVAPVFETTARGSDSVSYVGSFAAISAAQPVVVAEVVVPAGDRVVLSIDGETTAVGGASGSNVRTVANDGLVIGRGTVELCAGCADRDRGVRKQ